MSEPRNRPSIPRDTAEFGRAVGFVDATFAIAATLLVTTLVPADRDWETWSRFWSTVDAPLLAFGLSFWVVGAYWWANHSFVGMLAEISQHLMMATLVLLGFVVLLPFSTRGLGTAPASAAEVTTVVYATNVGIVSGMETVLYRIAWRERLFLRAPSAREVMARSVAQLVPTAVFFVSIPVTLLGNPTAGRLTWLALIPLGPLVGRWANARLDDAPARRSAP
jgi:uncharacterized membrane protein